MMIQVVCKLNEMMNFETVTVNPVLFALTLFSLIIAIEVDREFKNPLKFPFKTTTYPKKNVQKYGQVIQMIYFHDTK